MNHLLFATCTSTHTHGHHSANRDQQSGSKGVAKSIVSYTRAVQRNLIKGLSTYDMLQNPIYMEAFCTSSSTTTDIDAVVGTGNSEKPNERAKSSKREKVCKYVDIYFLQCTNLNVTSMYRIRVIERVRGRLSVDLIVRLRVPRLYHYLSLR